MRRPALHLMLALGLALGVFAGTALGAGAQDDEPNELFFPWVPNGAQIDDDRDFGTTGPYYGTVTVQNLEDHEINVAWNATQTDDSGTESLDAFASTTLTTSELFSDDNDVDGSGLIVTGGNGARIAAVQKQAAPVPPGDDATTNDEHEIVAGYTGLTGDEIGTDLILPIVQTNNNWNTLIRLTNFADTTNRVEVTLHEADATEPDRTIEVFVSGGQTETIDLLEEGVPDGWTGSARIDSELNVSAAAERVKNETNMLIMNTSQPAQDGQTQYAPLVFQEWFNWNTGISVANLADATNVVTITYYDLEGEVADEDEVVVPPNGMDFVYTPATVLNDNDEVDEGFVGSAIIEGTQLFRAAVDEVKYFGDMPDVNHAMSYMVEDEAVHAAGPNETLALPLVQRGTVDEFDVVHGDTSGMHLFNPDNENSVVAAIWFIDDNGNPVAGMPDVVHLGPREGYTAYTIDYADLPEGFQGSAIVQTVFGDGQVTAVSNTVNYDVEFDGSASFNLVHTGAVNLPIGFAERAETLNVIQDSGLNEIDEEHTVTATVTDEEGDGVADLVVQFEVEGAHEVAGFGLTDAEGQAEFSYTGTPAGDDDITVDVIGTDLEDSLLKVWTEEVIRGTASGVEDVEDLEEFWRVEIFLNEEDRPDDPLHPQNAWDAEDLTRILYERPSGETTDLEPEGADALYWTKPTDDEQYAEGQHTVYYLYQGEWYALTSTFDENGVLVAVNNEPYPPENDDST